MIKKTINEAISAVLEEVGKPMTSKEIYDRIVTKGYYQFTAKSPAAIVSGELRKRTEGSKTLSGKAVYKRDTKGLYIFNHKTS